MASETAAHPKATSLLGMSEPDMRALAEELGEPAYRGAQLARWVYQRCAQDFSEMTDLPAGLRALLAGRYRIGRSTIATERRSPDGTVKYLLALHDGQTVETVGIPYEDRFSVCVSTQVGCPVKCAFCATGASGYTRNLTAGEIVDQVVTVQEHLRSSGPEDAPSSVGALLAAPSPAGHNIHRRVSHVVFMGMGEPLLNYDATVNALRLLNAELGIGMRRITVSTVGFVPGIRKLAAEDLDITLAVSLHAPTDELRRRLIPTMTRWQVADILDACRAYVADTGRRVTFEYCLLDGVNDGAAEAQELAAVIGGLNCHVNLIPHNPVAGLPFQTPKTPRVKAFRRVLEEAGVQVTQRMQRGVTIDAACGQLKRSVATSRA